MSIKFKLIHGIDITNTSRPEYCNENLKEKILSIIELNEFNILENKLDKIKYLATHWAIKEAIFKSIKPNIISFPNIEISKIDNVYVWTNKPPFIEEFIISTSTEESAVVASVYGLIKK